MPSRQNLVEELQRLMTRLATASVATRPTPWLNVDLSMPQLKALMALHDRGAVRVGEVAHMLAMSANATTAVLDRLEDEALIRRQLDPSDRRAVLVELTEHGTDWITELLAANVRAFTDVLEQLEEPDLFALHQGMAALSAVLEQRRELEGRAGHPSGE